MHVLFRVSDAGNPKQKLPFTDPLFCLDNTVSVFGKEVLSVFADNCSADTLRLIRERGIEPHETALGNEGSFLNVFDYSIRTFGDEETVYLLEDDYLHLSNAPRLLEDGLSIADYVTLYDHPDKYMNAEEGGPNMFVEDGGELSRVLVTASSHWKTTNSTTMTFAAKAKTLREDAPVWRRFGIHDFEAFLFLQQQPRTVVEKVRYTIFPRKKRRLVSALPAASTHCEEAFLAPLVDWTTFEVRN